ncbi:MAG: head-tail joining protein [Cellvibrionaceae bacterium]
MDFDRLAAIADRVSLSVVGTSVWLVLAEREIRGVFDMPVEDEPVAGFVIDLSKPRLSVSEVEASSLHPDERLLIKGNRYQVLKQVPDGTGLVVLVLAKSR